MRDARIRRRLMAVVLATVALLAACDARDDGARVRDKDGEGESLYEEQDAS